MSTETTQRSVVSTRVFDAPVEQVWQAWSQGDQIRRWWGPHGFTVPVANVDFREGGTTLVSMRAPEGYGGQTLYNTWTYTQIEPHKRLEFMLNFADEHGTRLDPAALGMPAGVPADVRHVITFTPLGAGRTAMTVTEYGYTTDEAHDISKGGLEQCLDKMAASFAAA